MGNQQHDLVIFIHDGAEAIEHPLGPFEAFSECIVGRGEEVQLFLNDASVSRRHCRLFRDGVGVSIEDLGSRAGTTINGRAISAITPLRPGQRVHVGEVVIEVRWPAPEPLTPPPKRSSAVATYYVQGGTQGKGSQTILRRPSDQAGGAQQPTELHLQLTGAAVTIGRSEECDVVLEDQLGVSRRHAKLVHLPGGWAIQDERSSNGTYLNGERVTRLEPLEPGDVVNIGPYQLTFTGDALTSRPPGQGASIEVRDAAVPGRGRDLVLQRVNFSIESGELVGVLGISGSGKTRLMHAMCGRAPLVEGNVLYDGRDLHANMDALKKSIGYVPSWLTLHDSLTVTEGLRFASRLRLSTDATDAEIDANIDRVLQTVKMIHRKTSSIRTLSDGEKRRVGLAVELLGAPPIMLLDEVTTALDLPTHCQFVKMFRGLADQGQSLLLISHHLEDLDLCDKWLYLIEGRVAFFGSPRAFLRHFNVKSLREQLENQENLRGKKNGKEWATDFERAYGTPRHDPMPESRVAPHAANARSSKQRWREIHRQGKLLTSRYVALLKSDRKNLGIMLGLAPIIAALMLTLNHLFKGSKAAGQTNVMAFMLVMSVIIIGTFMSVREIVKENDLLRHERFAGLDYLAYYLSKFLPLSILSVASGLTVALILRVLGGSDAISLSAANLTLVGVTGVGAVALGLFISAIVDSSEKAFMLLAPVLIVQLCFAGIFGKLEGSIIEPLSKSLVLSYWPFQVVKPGSQDWGKPLVALTIQIVVYVLATLVLLIRKDGGALIPRLKREALDLVPIPRKTSPHAG